jgi:hypothetical protein
MSRDRIGQLALLCVAIAIVIWVARSTYWTEMKVPMPPKGEAATNPFYVIQRFSEELGAHARWKRGLELPRPDGIVFISDWNWDLTADRRERIEHWVESGGRLVVDRSLITTSDAFEHWSGLKSQPLDPPKSRKETRFPPETPGMPRCYTLDEQHGTTREGESRTYSICGMAAYSEIRSRQRIAWALGRKDVGNQAVRVASGRGSITMLNGTPFAERGLFDDDNPELFVAATQLLRGDQIYFFSESDHSTLLQLAWEYGWPAIALGLILLALALWRSGARFGPPVAATETARRSLAEQIRGTGAFTLRLGGGASLHHAVARALNEAASRYITAYDRLQGAERLSALAQATGYEANALAAALNYSGSLRPEQLRATLELLEGARRRILLQAHKVQTWK